MRYTGFTPAQLTVDAIRRTLGKAPLYQLEIPERTPYGGHLCGYLRLEKLKSLAKPDCTTCGGTGYRHGNMGCEWSCHCTGNASRVRGRGPSCSSS